MTTCAYLEWALSLFVVVPSDLFPVYARLRDDHVASAPLIQGCGSHAMIAFPVMFGPWAELSRQSIIPWAS